MADVTSSDLTKGPEVKWYLGGVATQESKTITTAEATATGFVLAGVTGSQADYGMLVLQVNGVSTAYTGHTGSTGASAASEALGITFVKYDGITAGDTVVVKYIDVSTTALTHIASCLDVSKTTKASSTKTAVHGQATKITSVGTQETTADFEALRYSQAFITAILGDSATGPTAGESTWTNVWQGFKKIGCLIGKKYNSAGAVTKKWGIIGCQPNELSTSFPTEDNYSDSFKFDVDYMIEWEA
ncbi:MAG: hypothetical protein M0Q91_09930 [Methanoregula sp.]|jgi:hypothetical protein|nr:hypothetical protein [Methanoregula sp.]